MQEFEVKIRCIQTPQGVQVAGVAGPLHDKVLCYGIFEGAKEAVQAFHAKQANSLGIQVPNAAQTALLGG